MSKYVKGLLGCLGFVAFCALGFLLLYYGGASSSGQSVSIYRSTKTAYTCQSESVVCVTYEDASAHSRHVYYEDFGSDGSADTVVVTISGQHGKDQLVRYIIGISSRGDLLGKDTQWGPVTVAFDSNDPKAAELQNEYYEVRQKYAKAHPEESKGYYENSEYADAGPARTDLNRISSFLKLHELGLNAGYYEKQMISSLLRDSYKDMRNNERRRTFEMLFGSYKDESMKDEGWGQFNELWFPKSDDPQWTMDSVPESERAKLKVLLAQLRKDGLATY